MDRDPQLGSGGHAGLWYDKFCNSWLVDGRGWSMRVGADRDQRGSRSESPKLEWIQTVTGHPVGVADDLRDYCERLVGLVGAHDGWLEVFTAVSRFVTGLGRSHPVENGFAWHPTLGTPYLPGSALKGMARARARDLGQETEANKLLGDRDRAGLVSVLDAVPLDPVILEADVLTPHYAGWEPGGDGSQLPGDWRSPTPVPFLAVASRTRLLVGMIPRARRDHQLSKEDRSRLRSWLQEALATAGGGAKTAVGYGRFESDPAAAERLLAAVADRDRLDRERRERDAAMATPAGRWRVLVSESTEEEVLEFVRVHLAVDSDTDPAEQVALAQAVREAGHLTSWRRGDKLEQRTQAGSRRLKERARQVIAVLVAAGLE
jgi:CRISPR-associated protein Cmr6